MNRMAGTNKRDEWMDPFGGMNRMIPAGLDGSGKTEVGCPKSEVGGQKTEDEMPGDD